MDSGPIPLDSTGFRWNPVIPAGICGAVKSTEYTFIPGTGFWLHSVPVHSREHSGVNSGMALFRWNKLSPEWQIWVGPLPKYNSSGFWQESVGQGKDLT